MLAAIKEVYFTRNVLLKNHFKEKQNIDTRRKERLQTNKKIFETLKILFCIAQTSIYMYIH